MEILWNTHVYNRKVLLKSLKKEKFTNKNGSHSALNMFTEYSMTDPGDLAEYFGFTEQEIYALCEKYEMSFEEAKTWYDGYQLIAHRQTGDEIYSMYSPKSVVEAMLRHRFGTYWNQTETYEALKIYIQMDMDGLKDSVVRMLAGINYNKKRRNMKKEYLIYKLSEEMKEATRIDTELFSKFDVKRGLRNEDGNR